MRFLIVQSGDMDSGLHFLACTPEGRLLRKFPDYASENGGDWDSNAFVWLKKFGRVLVMVGNIERPLPDGKLTFVRNLDTYDTRTWRRTSHRVLSSKTPLPSPSSGQVIFGELAFETLFFCFFRRHPSRKLVEAQCEFPI